MELGANYKIAQLEYLAILSQHPECVGMCNIQSIYFENKLYQLFHDYLLKSSNFDLVEFVKEVYSKGNKELERDANKLLSDLVNLAQPVNVRAFVQLRAKQIIDGYKRKMIEEAKKELDGLKIDEDEYLEKIINLSKLTIEAKKEKISSSGIRDRIANKKDGILLKDFPILTRAMKIVPSDIITIAGPSGFGKSAFAINLFNAFANEHDSMLQYYNLEIAQETFDTKLLAINSRKQGNYKVDDFNAKNIEKDWFNKCLDRIDTINGIIETGSITLERLKSSIIANLEENKMNVVFVDHIGLINIEDESIGKDDYSRITHIMKNLRELALDHKIILFLVSQIDRASLKQKQISMHSLKGSGEIENSSTHVILLKPWSEKEEAEKTQEEKRKEVISLDIAKNRNGDREGITYEFYKQTQCFYEKM